MGTCGVLSTFSSPPTLRMSHCDSVAQCRPLLRQACCPMMSNDVQGGVHHAGFNINDVLVSSMHGPFNENVQHTFSMRVLAFVMEGSSSVTNTPPSRGTFTACYVSPDREGSNPIHEPTQLSSWGARFRCASSTTPTSASCTSFISRCSTSR